MNNILSKIALIIAIAALLVGIGGFFFPAQLASLGVAFEGATCSGVGGCTAFPGILRTDNIQSGSMSAITAPLTLSTTVSSSLVTNFPCLYDLINISGGLLPTSTTAIVITLPPAASTTQGVIGTTPACLTVDGGNDVVFFRVSDTTSTITFATSTGDSFVYNASSSLATLTTSSPLSPTLASSTLTNVFKMDIMRVTSSTVDYTLSIIGTER